MVLENLQYLPLLQLHSPFQFVVLDGRIVNFLLHTKNYNKQFKLFTVANEISDIANSFIVILSHFSAVSWLNVAYIFLS